MMKKYLLIFVVFLLAGCAANQTAEERTAANTDSEEPPRSKRVYYLQHKLIPMWLYESEGAFYWDMREGSLSQLLDAATEIVDQEYADGIFVTPIETADAVLITFPKPTSFPNCYFAIMERSGDSFTYTTYESTTDWEDEGIYGVVGGWSEEGDRANYGARRYQTAAEFVEDVLSGKPEPVGTTTLPRDSDSD